VLVIINRGNALTVKIVVRMFGHEGIRIITSGLEQWYKWERHHTSTKNLKTLGLWVFSFIKCSTFIFPSDVW